MDIHADLLQRRRIDATSAGIHLTTAEFDALEEEDVDESYRYELVDRVLVVTPLEGPANADPNDYIGHLLRTYQETQPQGGCLDKTLPERYIHLPNSRRKPDRVIWIGLGRIPDMRSDVPTIAIEFVSSGKRSWLRDYVEKRAEYLAQGVQEYWVIDRFERCLSVFTPGVIGPRELIVREGDAYRTPLLPGFELPLAKVLAVADEWS